MRTSVGIFLIILFAVASAQSSEECQRLQRPAAMPWDCCPVDSILDGDFVKNCDISSSTNNCIGDCIYRENKLLKGNDLDINAIKAFIKVYLSNPAWTPVIDKALPLCTASAEKEPLPNNCKTPAEPFMHCMHMHIMGSCPDSLWSTEQKCTELRNYMQKCPKDIYGMEGLGTPGGPGGPGRPDGAGNPRGRMPSN